MVSLIKVVNLSTKNQTVEKFNEIDYRDIQIQTEEFNEEPISALHYKNREEQNKVFVQPTLIYTITIQELSNDSVRVKWTPVPVLGLRRFKETRVTYGIHSPFVKQMLNSWSLCNRIILNDWIELVKAIYSLFYSYNGLSGSGNQAKTIEQWSKARAMELSQDQILGEGNYATVER